MSTRWTEADFEALSWHDNHVHGLDIREATPEHGTGELVLYLDHITEWLPAVDGAFRFRVAPAVLTFREISGLRLEVDYARVSAAVTAFSIGSIEREEVQYSTGYVSYRWTILVNWPEGRITFAAPGFTQVLTAAPVETSNQELPRSPRSTSAGA